MWPKRKILLLTPYGAEEGLGFQALLDALKIETIIREVSAEEPLDLTGLTISSVDGQEEDLSDCGPTEIVYWPEFDSQNNYRRWGENQGLTQESAADFLHRLWDQDVVLPVSEGAQKEGRPLLWQVLAEAGYEPSVLWPGADSHWQAEQGRGLHWVVPETWLKKLFKDESVGRKPNYRFPEAYWVIRDEFVDFYAEPGSFRYFGRLHRSPLGEGEEMIYHEILQGLQLGVSWWEVKKNIRWNVDVDEWNRGTNGAECSVEDSKHLEDRWFS
ncbi:hypothetical protein [Desulfitobacterium sp.]|uniref:hypothetical protein n=1 Tax=Desulfitobacterium sp. TaxID=49981 RepID=UPI002BA2EED0|nr:hypothetical protein [Desulfitobacterium sp.]HVJ48199.1 hypothetical protein [Desulfitobacterium sp.]